MYKNVQPPLDGNTSKGHLLEFIQPLEDKNFTNIDNFIELIDKISENKKRDISRTLTDSNKNNIFNFPNKIHENNINLVNQENNTKSKMSSLIENINSNKPLKHTTSIKKKRKSSTMSIKQKDPLDFYKSLRNLSDHSSNYGKNLKKIKYCDIFLALLTMISFICIIFDNKCFVTKSLDFINKIISEENDKKKKEYLKKIGERKISLSENIFRITNIVISIIIIFLLIIKYNYQLYFEKKNEKIVENKTIFSSKLSINLLLECIVCLFIYPPNLNYTFYVIVYDNVYVISLNSIFLFLNVIKLYNVFRLVRIFSKFNSRISKTICESHKIESGFSFVIKSELNNRKLILTISILIFYIIIISTIIKDFECLAFNKKTLLYGKKGLNDLQNYINTLWLTISTITSVSYGDEYPRTFFGRILIFHVSFVGIFCLGIIIASFSEKLEFNQNEKKAYLRLQKIFNPENKKHQAGNVIKTFLFIVRNIKNRNQENKQSNLNEKICLLIKLRTELKLFKNELHASRAYSTPIDDIVQTMENKIYYNLIDITNNLEKINSIEDDFNIICDNQYYIMKKLRNTFFFQNNISKYLTEVQNKNCLLSMKKNPSENDENSDSSNFFNNSSLTFQLNSSNYKLKIKKKANKFLTPRYHHKSRKELLSEMKKEKVRSTSKFKNSGFHFSRINFTKNNFNSIITNKINKNKDILDQGYSKISHKVYNKLLHIKIEQNKRHHSTPKVPINFEKKMEN